MEKRGAVMKKNKWIVIGCNLVGAVCFGIVSYGHFYRGRIEIGLLFAVLFGLWHIGYAVGIYLWQGGNMLRCIVMKVLWGTMYGLFLGAIRLKTKNCYLGILAHGALNVFG